MVTDKDGYVLGCKVETYEWHPSKIIRQGLSKSTKALRSLQPGETKRITHGDVKCIMQTYPSLKRKSSIRACTLIHEIAKLRKSGWELEHYHEADHIMVVRRIK